MSHDKRERARLREASADVREIHAPIDEAYKLLVAAAFLHKAFGDWHLTTESKKENIHKMSTDMIKEMSGLKNFDYQVSEPAKSALIKKQSAAPNPDRLAYESNVKQPAGKIFQGPDSMLQYEIYQLSPNFYLLKLLNPYIYMDFITTGLPAYSDSAGTSNHLLTLSL